MSVSKSGRCSPFYFPPSYFFVRGQTRGRHRHAVSGQPSGALLSPSAPAAERGKKQSPRLVAAVRFDSPLLLRDNCFCSRDASVFIVCRGKGSGGDEVVGGVRRGAEMPVVTPVNRRQVPQMLRGEESKGGGTMAHCSASGVESGAMSLASEKDVFALVTATFSCLFFGEMFRKGQ